MSALQLYLDKKYHKVILARESCVSFIDLTCLWLSLAALGRKQCAVTLLTMRMEEETSPSHKHTLLRCIHSLTQDPFCLEEIEYWESLKVWSNTGSPWELISPVPPCEEASALVQVQSFVKEFAFVHPESYSHSVLEDHKLAESVKSSSDSLILSVVEKCGSIHAITNCITNMVCPPVNPSSTDQTELMDQVLTSSRLKILNKRMAEIACAYLKGNYNQVLEDSLFYIKEVTDIRQFVVNPCIRGLSDFDLETLCMLCSQCVTKDTPERILDYLLRQLLDPGEVVSVGDSEYSRKESRSSFKASQLRRSSFFLSCGHILKAKAYRNSKFITINIGTKNVRGTVLDRDEGLEMTRKYVIAAALQPLDHPKLHEFYDQIIWSLLLCGHIDLKVLWVFFCLRNHFYKLSFFSFSEPCRSFGSWSMRPDLENKPELFGRFYNDCEAATQQTVPISHILVESQKRLFPLIHYGEHFESCTLNQDGDLTSDSPDKASANYLPKCLKVSHEILHLWVSVYKEIRAEVPSEIEDTLTEFHDYAHI